MSEERKATEAAAVPEHNQHWRNPETGQAECECCSKWELDYAQLEQELRDERLAFEHANEVVGKLEQENRQLREERDEFERKGKDLCCAYGNSLITIHDLKARAEKAESEVERRGAPLSDEEWLGLCSGDHVQIADVQRHEIDAVIAARAAEPGKEDGNV